MAKSPGGPTFAQVPQPQEHSYLPGSLDAMVRGPSQGQISSPIQFHRPAPSWTDNRPESGCILDMFPTHPSAQDSFLKMISPT